MFAGFRSNRLEIRVSVKYLSKYCSILCSRKSMNFKIIQKDHFSSYFFFLSICIFLTVNTICFSPILFGFHYLDAFFILFRFILKKMSWFFILCSCYFLSVSFFLIYRLRQKIAHKTTMHQWKSGWNFFNFSCKNSEMEIVFEIKIVRYATGERERARARAWKENERKKKRTHTAQKLKSVFKDFLIVFLQLRKEKRVVWTQKMQTNTYQRKRIEEITKNKIQTHNLFSWKSS